MDSDIVYEIGSVEMTMENPEDPAKTMTLTSYYNVWGYEGDVYGHQIGNNLLPNNEYKTGQDINYVCGDAGVLPDYLSNTNLSPDDVWWIY